MASDDVGDTELKLDKLFQKWTNLPRVVQSNIMVQLNTGIWGFLLTRINFKL